jgi:hypothetical protein
MAAARPASSGQLRRQRGGATPTVVWLARPHVRGVEHHNLLAQGVGGLLHGGQGCGECMQCSGKRVGGEEREVWAVSFSACAVSTSRARLEEGDGEQGGGLLRAHVHGDGILHKLESGPSQGRHLGHNVYDESCSQGTVRAGGMQTHPARIHAFPCIPVPLLVGRPSVRTDGTVRNCFKE